MKTINEQLNIGIAPSPLTPTRYDRGLKTAQPQLGTEDWSLDFYNDTRALANMSNLEGVPLRGQRELISQDSFSGFLGGYPPCIDKKCKICKKGCQAKGLKWKSGGKECHKGCVAVAIQGKLDAKTDPNILTAPDVIGETMIAGVAPTKTGKTGMSNGAKIGITVGVIAVIGIGAYLIFRKK